MSVYHSILKQWIIDPIQNSIVVPIFNHSIQTLLLFLLILPIINHFTANPIKTLLLPIILSIFNQWIIDPLRNYITVPVLNQLTTDRIQILPIFDLLTTDPIRKFFHLPIVDFIGKQIKDQLPKLVFNYLLKYVFDHLHKFVFVPIKTHICYPFKCDSYVDKLKKQTEKLKEKRDILEQSAVEVDEVTEWLSCANNEIDEAEALIQRKEEVKMKKCLFGLCPNLNSRYQLSNEADKKASAIDKLRNHEGLVPFSSSPHLQQTVQPSVYSREALPSRLLILNQVMDALNDPKLYMIGVYGLGGVGKTTLAMEVQRKALEGKMFKRVIMVTVTQKPDLRKIQGEIADFIGMIFDAQEVLGRASQLNNCLKRSKVLIILDDIWTEFELNAVGIPLEDECDGSKLLLTSRSHDVLSCEMGTHKEFSLEVLGEEETWKLFQKTLKDANNPELQGIAIKVSKKCSGLPLLVKIVAADLKKTKDLSAWSDALVKLSDHDNAEIHGKVHEVLKSSYENLSSDAKSLFLLCCLFGQSNIRIDHLLTYAMGLGLFKNIVSVKQARDRLSQTIKKLETESWLLDGCMNGYVKMHDVVLDFARSIAIKDQHAFFGTTGNGLRQLWPVDENCTRIVLHHCDVSELSEGLEYPNAELLSLFTEDFTLVIPNLFFRGMKKLKVLNLTGMCLTPLPSSLQLLTNIHSLYMHQCRLKDVAIIGDLKQLKFLSFEDSHIVKLPRQLEELTQLKSLNLNYCREFKVFPPNVLPKLSLLEELYINSFDEWDENGNASLMELEVLRRLTTLEVGVSAPKKLPNQLFSKGLERYRILIGKKYWNWLVNYDSSRTLKLKLETSIHLDVGLKELLRGSGDLFLGEVTGMENGLYDLNEEGFPELKHLYIADNKAIRHIIDSTMWVSCDAFPILETLALKSLHSLKEICCGRLGTESFKKLRTLNITNCGKLKKIFSFFTAKNLSQLQEMEVRDCDNLEALIAEGSEDGICNPNQTVTDQFADDDSFCKLKSLKIERCSKLKAVFATSNVLRRFQRLEYLKLYGLTKVEGIYELEGLDGIDGVAFELRYLKIQRMSSLKRIWSEDSNGVFPFPNLESIKVSRCHVLEFVFPASSISFKNLTTLHVSRCDMLKNLVTPSTAKTMKHLTELKVEYCQLMTQIVADGGDDAEHEITFEQLKSLELIQLSNLNSFCSRNNCTFHFPSLEKLLIDECTGLMTIFSRGELTTPKLRGVKFMGEQHWEGNLNATITSIFTKQESLNIRSSSSTKAISSTQVQLMNNMKNIDVQDSDKVQLVFDLEAVSLVVLLPQLQKLSLIDLPMLTQIWNKDPVGIIDFSRLEVLILYNCSSLKYAFTPSVASCLIQLRHVEVCCCEMMETIIKAEEAKERVALANKMILPSLERVDLYCLPKLSSLYSGIDILECPSLKKIWIIFCPNLKDFISSLSRTQNPTDDDGSKQIQEIHQISMTSLEHLGIDWNLIKCIFNGNHQPDFLSKLKFLGLSGFDDECGVFPLKSFPNIEALLLHDSLVEEIIISEPNASKNKYLVDANDPQTASIIQNFEGFGVYEYHRLKILVPSSVCFKNLTFLEVAECNEMINLITVSTAKSLMLLTTMIISDCKVMQEIVGVELDGSEDVIGFNQLELLVLFNLPSLTSFCSGNCAFNFPHLDDVRIIRCSNMKTFSQQAVTPKLREVATSDYRDWKQDDLDWKQYLDYNWEGSLNNTIQKLFMNRMKRMKK